MAGALLSPEQREALGRAIRLEEFVAQLMPTAYREAVERPEIADDLRVAAAQPAPGPAELGRITGPVTIVALADDPTHPLAVAQHWAAAMAHSELHVLPRDLAGRAPQALADFLP